MLEYYCHGCGHLRLHLKDGKPTRCGNCGSERIEVDEAGSDRLYRLRFGDDVPSPTEEDKEDLAIAIAIEHARHARPANAR